jgi:serine/threonine-protein kinase
MATPQRLGKYEITEVLGTGAMGVVYKGFDPGIRRTVAIKTIRRELIEGDRAAGSMLARFRNEARAAGRLSHPGIVAVHDYGEDAEVAYIAMEYVEGNSLREYFSRGTRFAERDAVSIMSQLLEALAHAHERRVWHRDIKPANLIVMMNGRVKVADFGIARIEASELTQTGAVLGSPGYMAPEQYAAAAIDHRADLFAAGVVFYQLLTGAKAFVGTMEQIAYAICHTEPLRPSLADPGKGWERYDAIVTKALAKKPEDRYQSAEEFRAAILAAHAAPVRAAVSEETIITEILRPAAAVDPSSPGRSPAAVLRPGASASPARKPARPWGWVAGTGLAAALVAAGATLLVYPRRAAPPPTPSEPVAAAPTAPAPPSRPQPDQEVVFWESVRNSTSPAELEAYIAKYPDGGFTPLARARLETLAAAEAKAKLAAAATPAPERKAPPDKQASVEPRKPAASPAPPKAQPDQEALFWESVRNSGSRAELEAYIARYPDGAFAPLARARIDALAAAEAKRAAQPQRAAETKPKTEVAALAPSGHYAGTWKGTVACEAFEGTNPFTAPVNVSMSGETFIVQRGVRDQPGYFLLRGSPEGDGRLQLLGTGISGMAKYRGQTYVAGFDGKLEGDRYQAPGRMGRRHCTLSMTRAGS